MTKIVKLNAVTVPPTPVDPALVEHLQGLLKQATEGEIQGIVYVTVSSAGSGQYHGVSSGWAGAASELTHVVLGGLSRLQNRLCQMIELRNS